jgi:hypothetical protein
MPQAARDEGALAQDLEVEQVVAVLDAGIEHVDEAGIGHEGDPCADPLDQRVGDQGGGVHHLGELADGEALAGEQLERTGDHRLIRGVRRGQHLVDRHAPARRIDAGEIGESAADIDPEPGPGSRHGSTPALRQRRP